MIAVLVALQFATKAMGQFVTGSCVNMVLVVATLCGGFWCGFATALVSPFLAYLLGIGPALIQLVPAIALGNISLAAIYALIYKKLDKAWLRDVLAVVLAAAVKLAVLCLLIGFFISWKTQCGFFSVSSRLIRPLPSFWNDHEDLS